MIDIAIAEVAGQLNQALKRQYRVEDDQELVVMSPLHEQDGSVAAEANEKLVVFLVNIERETQVRQGSYSGAAGARLALSAAPVHLNLMLMFAANFGGGKYREALKFIASTVGFFQGRPLFDHQNSPDLDPRIDRLTLEIENLSVSDLSNLWGVLSGKYLPSVLYRMRLLSIDSGRITTRVPGVTQPEVGLGA